MAGLFSGEPAPAAIHKASQEENPGEGGGGWYFSRDEIEEISPSRRDGIDLKKEACLRKSYCRFLRVLGMRLKVPQVTIATSIIFCHRFFLRQSHAQNDWRIIATVCMFLAGKVEETPRPLKDVILVSYEIIHKKDPAAKQRIRQKEMYEQQKELILLGERVVLATLGFDLSLHHPYKPLVDAMKKFKVDQIYLAQVAWNFVNDGLRTSLWLQFMPHHIAAGAIFLAAKFLKVKLPSDGERVWWQEFDITPRQLEEVSNQMLELYERNPVPEAEGSVVDHTHSSSHGASTSKAASSNEALSKQNPDQTHAENHSGPSRITQTRVGSGNSEITSTRRDNDGHKKSRSEIGDHNEDDREISAAGNEMRYNNSGLMKDGRQVRNLSNTDAMLGQSPQDANKNLDREKLKAAFEQRRKALGDRSHSKVELMDELERELEDVEVTGPSERIAKPERQQNWPRSSNNKEHEIPPSKHASDSVDGNCLVIEGQSSHGDDFDTVEEGELGPFDDAEKGYKSPKSSSRKRKLGDYQEDRNGLVRHGYSNREYKRQQLQENHVLKW